MQWKMHDDVEKTRQNFQISKIPKYYMHIFWVWYEKVNITASSFKVHTILQNQDIMNIRHNMIIRCQSPKYENGF